MDIYSAGDAERDLRAVLDGAPTDAVSGEWTATTMQAGHASRMGGYHSRDGSLLDHDDASLRILDDVVARIAAGSATPVNKVVVRWSRARLPWQRGTVRVEATFDAALVPRGPDDPLYAKAADARRSFWNSVGTAEPGFALERGEANIHGQTRWFQPHRRIMQVQAGDQILLATDGLSTPWAGVTTPENGVECEVFMRLGGAGNPMPSDPASLSLWAGVLIGVGDLVADGYRVARDVRENGAILFCRLHAECRPMTRLALSADSRVIEGLPFGPVPLIEATPLRDDELAGMDEDDPWGASGARRALQRRGILSG